MNGRMPAVLMAVAALAGCASAPSPRTHFYVLSVEAGSGRLEVAAAPAPAAGGRVSVTRVAIPGVVDRPQIVTRTTSNSVEILDFHRWAEPLQEAIPRVIAGNLALQLGPRYAVAAGMMPGLPPDVRIAVDIQKMDAVTGNGVTVEALWSVRPAAGAALSGRSTVEERAVEAGPPGIAAAYSRALAAVARDIANAVAAEPVSRSPGSRP